ncbi:MAG: hypothetical protein NTX81_00165 [Candidatus Bathyarchaeota archaeon]|nr:hypothetical protein [Candidatus Bathyarchaeota archaeon]
MPATEFVNTSIREGQVTPYCFKKQGISCIVNYRSMRFQGTDISVIALHYSGPSKVSTRLIVIGTNASLKGAADCIFNFEKETGVLISYSIKESAPLLISSESTTFNMSRCAITITNSGNYTESMGNNDCGSRNCHTCHGSTSNTEVQTLESVHP